MKVLVVHTSPPERIAAGRQARELDLEGAARGIAAVLPEAVLARVRGEPRELLALLDEHAPDVVYNVCEAPLGRPDLEAHVAALFEWTGVRFTGSGSETLALCRRKDRVAPVLAAAGLPVPPTGGFPCIVKPASEDGSVGIDGESVCADAAALARACARAHGTVVIEDFLPGREFVVSLWGAFGPEHVSVGEICFRNGLRLMTYAAKWDAESADYEDSPLTYRFDLDEGTEEALIAAARGAWRAVGARGCLRVDLRLDARGEPRILDVNPNPAFGPDVGIQRAAGEAGWTWERFVRAQIAWAVAR